MIYITEKAALKIKEISEAEGIGHFNLRVKVVGGGCAGFSYDLYFENMPTDMDEVSEIDGVKMFVDPLSWQYLDEVSVDYVDELTGSGLNIAMIMEKQTF